MTSSEADCAASRCGSWFRLTPDRLISLLLAVEVSLWLSQRFQLFVLNEQKGWTVLVAAGVAGATLIAMLLWFLAALVFRCRFQFGLRSLLVLVVGVAVPCTWLAVAMRQAGVQQSAVAAIDGRGGVVEYDYAVNEVGQPVMLSAAGPPACDWMRGMLGESFFADVAWTSVQNDAEMENLRLFPGLQGLQIDTENITRRGMTHLRAASQIRSLALVWTATDEWLNHLESVPDLQSLAIDGESVTGRGLARLRGLPHLDTLILQRTGMTDADLVHLEGLTQLRSLHLCGHPFTTEEIRRLQQALPNCKIER